jgi:hypothetical protein
MPNRSFLLTPRVTAVTQHVFLAFSVDTRGFKLFFFLRYTRHMSCGTTGIECM